MKAFIFAMFMILSVSLIACGTNESTEGTADSTAVTVDTNTVPTVSVVPDSTL